MRYTHLKVSQLKVELKKRGLTATGSFDALIERLVIHDEERGSAATARWIEPLLTYVPGSQNIVSSAYGPPENPAALVGQEIIHYSLNPFAQPTLTLYTTTGTAFTLSGTCLRYALIGLDAPLSTTLRRVTGEISNVIRPGTHPYRPLRILAASYAMRTSIAAKPLVDIEADEQWQSVMRRPSLRGLGLPPKVITGEKEEEKGIWEEKHYVVGLQLEGMKAVGYVYAYDGSGDGEDGDLDKEGGCWGDVGLHAVKRETWNPIRSVGTIVVRDWVGEKREERAEVMDWQGSDIDAEGSELSEVDEAVIRGGSVAMETVLGEKTPRMRLDSADSQDDDVAGPWDRVSTLVEATEVPKDCRLRD